MSLSGCGDLKCEALGALSELDYRMEFEVDQNDIPVFNAALKSYLVREGFTYQMGKDENYVSPPDSSGHQIKFTYFQTVGCNLESVIWSDNVMSERSFYVTIHRTYFGSAKQSARRANEIKAILGSAGGTPIRVTITKIA